MCLTAESTSTVLAPSSTLYEIYHKNIYTFVWFFFCVQIIFEAKNAAHSAKFGEEIPPWSWGRKRRMWTAGIEDKEAAFVFSLCLPSLWLDCWCVDGYSINQQWCYVATTVKSTDVNGAKTHSFIWFYANIGADHFFLVIIKTQQ